MNWRAIWAIVRRDLAVLAGSKPVVIPLVVLPLVLFVGLPLLLGLVPQAINLPGGADASGLLGRLPDTVVAGLPADEDARVAVVLLTYLVAPIYLIAPLFVAAVIAADSIAGGASARPSRVCSWHRSPTASCWWRRCSGRGCPRSLSRWSGAVTYGIVANLAVGGMVDTLPFPNLLWTVLALWVAPALAAAALGGVVLISGRVRGFQEAYQLGGLMVLPLVALLVSQITGVLFLGPGVLVAAGAVTWALAAAAARDRRRDAAAHAARRTALKTGLDYQLVAGDISGREFDSPDPYHDASGNGVAARFSVMSVVSRRLPVEGLGVGDGSGLP